MGYRFLGSAELPSDSSTINWSDLPFSDGAGLSIHYELDASIDGPCTVEITSSNGDSTNGKFLYGIQHYAQIYNLVTRTNILETFNFNLFPPCNAIGEFTIYSYGQTNTVMPWYSTSVIAASEFSNKRNLTIHNKYSAGVKNFDYTAVVYDEYYIYELANFDNPETITVSISKNSGTFTAGSNFTFYQITH